MDAVRSHYATLLAPIYSWMAGGSEAALARGEAELDSLQLAPDGSALAVRRCDSRLDGCLRSFTPPAFK